MLRQFHGGGLGTPISERVGASAVPAYQEGGMMATLTCYFCDEFEIAGPDFDDISMFFCDDCQRWQCNTEECGCVCSTTDGELFDWFVDVLTSPQELVNSGLKNLKVAVTEWMLSGPNYIKFYGVPSLQSGITGRIYDEAKRRLENDVETKTLWPRRSSRIFEGGERCH